MYEPAIIETPPRAQPADVVGDEENRCWLCGKRTRKGSGWWIEVIDGGDHIANVGLDPDPNDPGYMGMHAIGPECAKKLPKGFAQKINY